MNYTMAQAKRDFQLGGIYAADIVKPGMRAGIWCVMLKRNRGEGSGWLVDARSLQPREFKTLDAAFSALEQIGMKPEALHAD